MQARSSTGAGLVWLLVQVVALSVAAAAPCDREWTVGDPEWQTRGSIGCATRWDPDGDGPRAEVMVVGGSFSQIGDLQSIANVAIWDGVNWMPLGSGLGGQVRTLEVIDGSLYAGGGFAFSGLGQCRSIARWTGGSAFSKPSIVRSLKTTPNPNVSSFRFRSWTTMSSLGWSFLRRMEK